MVKWGEKNQNQDIPAKRMGLSEGESQCLAPLRKASLSPIIVITVPDNCVGAGSLSGSVSVYPFSIPSVIVPGRDLSVCPHSHYAETPPKMWAA